MLSSAGVHGRSPISRTPNNPHRMNQESCRLPRRSGVLRRTPRNPNSISSRAAAYPHMRKGVYMDPTFNTSTYRVSVIGDSDSDVYRNSLNASRMIELRMAYGYT